MLKLARSDEPKVNQVQIKSKSQIPPFSKGGDEGGLLIEFEL
jgi:hypothetical protein